MNKNNEVLLTQKEYDGLEEKLEELISVKRKEVAERLKEAISYGDLSENAEYDAAKDEQAELEEEITKIEDMLKNAIVVGGDDLSLDSVNVGCRVKVQKYKKNKGSEEYKLGAEEEFIIVGTKVDPFSEPPRISRDSAIGRSLLNKRINEFAAVELIDEENVFYEILDIAKEDEN